MSAKIPWRKHQAEQQRGEELGNDQQETRRDTEQQQRHRRLTQCVAPLSPTDRGFWQGDRGDGPRMAADFTAAFASRSRDEWAGLFAGTDACVTPVLSMAEAAQHPHNVDRGIFMTRGGITQPAPAPRFSVTTTAVAEPETLDIAAAVERWGARAAG